MTTKTLFVRILPKTGPEKFFRCGVEFTRSWKLVEVDAATAQRLQSEQMLAVTADAPKDYVPPEEAQALVDAQAAADVKVAHLLRAALVDAQPLLQAALVDAKVAADAAQNTTSNPDTTEKTGTEPPTPGDMQTQAAADAAQDVPAEPVVAQGKKR